MENGDLSAKELSQRLNSCVGWNKNTTYTVIKKCVDKGAIARLEPNFICHALFSRREAQREEHRRFWTGRLTAQQSS